jgi:sugar-specific transcriptional regulator TrmB
MNSEDTNIQLLMDIGLSKIQARIYLALLKGDKFTGYAVAKQLYEPVANTYKALDSLHKKGLVLLDHSERVKYYTAQPIRYYLDQLELRFADKRKVIENVIKPEESETFEEGIYRIDSYEQLYTQSSALIEKSLEIIALDSTALPIEQIKKELHKASKRGTIILIRSYEEIKISNCEVVYSREMGSPVYELPIQYFHLIVPGEGYITALLNHENRQLLYGVYTQNLFLSIVAYNGFLMELFSTKALNMLFQGKQGEEVLQEWKKMDPVLASKTTAWKKFIKIVTSEMQETDD